MEAKASVRHIRIAPRKVRFVVDTIRGKHVQDALDILKFTPNAAAKTVEKLVKSAIANAENNFHMNSDMLKVASIRVDEGPTMKRIQPRAMGRAYRILKRTSHISIVVADTEKPAKRQTKREAVKTAKPTRRGAQKAQKAEAAAKPAGTKRTATKKTTEGGE